MICTWFCRCLRTVQTSLMRTKHLAFSRKKLELFSGKSLFPMGGLDEDEDWEAIIWVDEYCRVLIQISTHTFISSSSSENENWEKEFSLLVQ